MNNAFSQIVSIIIAALILFLMPLSFLYGRTDNLRQMYVMTQTEYFVDSVCNTGFLSKEMYEQYLRSISDKGAVYTVEITRETPVYTYTSEGYEKSYEYYDTDEIVAALECGERYYFFKGDFIRAEVIKVSDINVFTRKFSKGTECYCGGQIKYETY
ncbi:MAG: hypothetical protein K6G40_07855 [Eubacterium sp.]|nr:hypothetical protein [Eubacterium sp.]